MARPSRSPAVRQIEQLLDAGDVYSARLLAARIVEEHPGSDDAREAAEIVSRLRPPRFAYLIAAIGVAVFVLLTILSTRYR